MIITNALYAEIDQLRAENKRLEEELESHAWEISPAMAQAKIDHLNARVEELEAEVAKLKGERDADRRREYGYSQQTVDALTADRDEWKRTALEGWWYE